MVEGYQSLHCTKLVLLGYEILSRGLIDLEIEGLTTVTVCACVRVCVHVCVCVCVCVCVSERDSDKRTCIYMYV